MGNLFLGFPVARAKIADMIAEQAPPLAHHAQHENGGSDEIDATGLNGAGGGGGGIGQILNLGTAIESVDGYKKEVAGSGIITNNENGVILDTGTTANSYARIFKYNLYALPAFHWNKTRSFMANVELRTLTSKEGEFYLGPFFPLTEQHVGFRIASGKIYGTVGNGTIETTVELQTISAVAYVVVRSLRLVFTPGVKCEFYIDGTLLGTITTGLPSGDDNSGVLLWAESLNNALAERKKLTVSTMQLQIQI